jgi:hypothetical protein
VAFEAADEVTDTGRGRSEDQLVREDCIDCIDCVDCVDEEFVDEDCISEDAVSFAKLLLRVLEGCLVLEEDCRLAVRPPEGRAVREGPVSWIVTARIQRSVAAY